MVALRALAEFAESTYTSDIEQSVTFSLPGLSSNVVRAVNKENRFQRFDVEVTSITNSRWCQSFLTSLVKALHYHCTLTTLVCSILRYRFSFALKGTQCSQ